MFEGFDTLWLAIVLALLIVTIYVAMCRWVLASFSRRLLLEKTPDAQKESLEKSLEHKDEYQITLQSLERILRLMCVVAFVMGRISAVDFDWSQLTFAAVATEALAVVGGMIVVYVVFLELLPGVIARVDPERWLLRTLGFMERVRRAFAPLRLVLSGLMRVGMTIFGGNSERSSADVLEDEILSAAEEGEREGLLESRDIDMIESIIGFGGRRVLGIHTPRTEMVCLDVDEPFEVNLRKAIACGHSRIPVFRESKDKIIGILHVKDLLHYRQEHKEVSLEKLVRKPNFVSTNKLIGELLQEFKTQRFHLAIVRDEHGGTAGLITIEDVLEEIVGDIIGEDEPEGAQPLRQVAPGLVEVSAKFRVEELNDRLEIELPVGDTYETVGGFVFTQMGQLPKVGDFFRHENLRFEVVSADDRRIHRLQIRIEPRDAQADVEVEGESASGEAILPDHEQIAPSREGEEVPLSHDGKEVPLSRGEVPLGRGGENVVREQGNVHQENGSSQPRRKSTLGAPKGAE